MVLTYRPATLDDLTSSLSTLAHSYGPDPEVHQNLPKVWKLLLEAECMISPILEDRSRPAGDRSVSLGATVFLTDDFVQELRQGKEPFVSAQIVRRILSGPSPILTLSQARRANRDEGLNLVILHNDQRTFPLDFSQIDHVREKTIEMFFHYHQGCNVKEFLQETYGEEAKKWMSTSGLSLLADYSEYYSDKPNKPSPERHPFFFGLTREEAREQMGSRAYRIFTHFPARFGFKSAEQEMLRRALLGETDEELAVSLHSAVSTIKKRWVAIYDRVTDTSAEMLGSRLAGDWNATGRRGGERRRYLLHYLSDHSEELLAINAAAP